LTDVEGSNLEQIPSAVSPLRRAGHACFGQQNGRFENKKPAVLKGRVDACGLVAPAGHICFCKPPCPEWQVGVGVNPTLDDGLIVEAIGWKSQLMTKSLMT
jgi:hypothetical protein